MACEMEWVVLAWEGDGEDAVTWDGEGGWRKPFCLFCIWLRDSCVNCFSSS
jgi:hypothetical protein